MNGETFAAAAETLPSRSRTTSPRAYPAGQGYDELLTKHELATRLKVTVRCLENWMRDGRLPFLRIESVVLFFWPEVLAHLLAHYRGSQGEV